MIVGMPALRLAAVVPAPPWCMALPLRGKSLNEIDLENG